MKIASYTAETAPDFQFITTPCGNTFSVGDNVRSIRGGKTGVITRIRKSTIGGHPPVVEFSKYNINVPCSQFLYLMRSKRDVFTKIDNITMVVAKNQSVNKRVVIKRDGICIKCIANPARDCDCMAIKKPRVLKNKKMDDSYPIFRIGWDNFTRYNKIGYLHYSSNTAIYTSNGLEYTWRGKYNPDTGKRKHLYSISPEHNVELLMIRIEDYLGKKETK